jgi:hypothetical protein
MVEYLKSFGEHLQFKKNENDIIIGGFPIAEIAKNQLEKYELLGGTKQRDDFGLSRYKDLAVPLGLYVEKDLNEIVGGSQKQNNNFIQGGTIPEDHFNKLFDLVSVMNVRGGLSKKYSRKNKDVQSKKSTKNKTKKFDE